MQFPTEGTSGERDDGRDGFSSAASSDAVKDEMTVRLQLWADPTQMQESGTSSEEQFQNSIGNNTQPEKQT